MVENDLTLEEARVTSAGPELFDDDGRRIPPEVKSAVHGDPRQRFTCAQPRIDYGEIHTRIKRHFGASDALSAAEFESRAETILKGLRSDSKIKNVVDGVRVP